MSQGLPNFGPGLNVSILDAAMIVLLITYYSKQPFSVQPKVLKTQEIVGEKWFVTALNNSRNNDNYINDTYFFL